MSKPSIFSRDYQKVMKRRKMIFRFTAVLVAVCVLFFIYDRSAIPGLKKVIQGIRLPAKIDFNIGRNKNNDVKDQKTKEGTDAGKTNDSSPQDQTQQMNSGQSSSEYQYKFPNGEIIFITYKKDGDSIKLTGIEPSSTGISYDIREDGGAIVFDNPRISDVWAFNSDGKSYKISPDSYIQLGENKEVYSKTSIMEQYQNNYVWAARPKYIKDGRVIYQSNLPWFKETNNYYLWISDGEGLNNRLLMSTDSSKPAEYNGFTAENQPIITIDNIKYVINVDDRSKQAIN